MTETEITFWGGLDTIGGNIVSIKYGTHRIITDFGAFVGADIDELLLPDRVNEFLDKKLLPAIDGLYSSKYLEKSSLLPYENSELETIILLSHLHLDHLGSLNQLPSNIKVITSSEAYDFYQQLKMHQLLPDYNVDWKGVGYNKTFNFGPFDITFHESDHDTVGASAIFIQSPDLKIIHSGDFRLSGYHPEKVLNWAVAAKQFEPDILLTEGTTFSFVDEPSSKDDNEIEELTEQISLETELDLLKKLNSIVKNESKDQIIAFNGYPQNVLRFLSIFELMHRQERTVVLEKAYFNLLQPNLDDKWHVEVWSDQLIPLIQSNPNQYCIQISADNMQTFSELPVGLYIHSNAVPLGPFMEGYETFVRTVVGLGWRFIHASIGGHARPTDLLLINYLVKAKLTVPWHTFKPELYAEAIDSYGLTSWLPELSRIYTVTDIKTNIK